MSMFPSPWFTVSSGLHSEDVTQVQLSTVRTTGRGVTTEAGAGGADGGREPECFLGKTIIFLMGLSIIALANRSATW